MGWGRFLFLGDWGQQLDLEEMRQGLEAERARLSRERSRNQSAREDMDARFAALERENDELRLYLAAVVRHLLEKRLLLRTELEALLSGIDAEDGASDGGHGGPLA